MLYISIFAWICIYMYILQLFGKTPLSFSHKHLFDLLTPFSSLYKGFYSCFWFCLPDVCVKLMNLSQSACFEGPVWFPVWLLYFTSFICFWRKWGMMWRARVWDPEAVLIRMRALTQGSHSESILKISICQMINEGLMLSNILIY